MINTTELKQIVTNICKNAEHAMVDKKVGNIDITMDVVKLNSKDRHRLDMVSNDCIKLSIQDEGEGIPQENLEKIFEPLFTTKEVGHGTGLGLSVVIGIIKSWGGAVDVDSTLGKGTTFTLFIPIYKREDDFSDLVDLVEELQSDI